MKFQKGILTETEREQQQAAHDAMKFQKGLLTEPELKQPQPKPATTPPSPQSMPNAPSAFNPEGDHLFETLREESGSQRNYLKLFAIVVAGVLIVGAAASYLTLPDIGDAVRAPAGLEMAVRDHFLTSQKRTATDIVFYTCDGFYGARVGVETRNDIPNPIFRIDTYSARAVDRGGQWEITAAPITPPETFTPCK